MKKTTANLDKQLSKKLNKILRRLDMLIVIFLAKSGFERKEIAKILDVSEITVAKMIPIRKLKPKKDDKE